MKKLLILITAVTLVLTAAAAMALTDTSSLTVSANVAETCTIQSVTNLNFGNYDTTNPADDDDGVGDFTFRCTKNTGYDLYITGSRTMTDGTDTLNFELYQGAGRTTAWPSSTPGITGTAADNSSITQDIYGRIAALQNVQAGNYTGTVTVTVEY